MARTKIYRHQSHQSVFPEDFTIDPCCPKIAYMILIPFPPPFFKLLVLVILAPGVIKDLSEQY